MVGLGIWILCKIQYIREDDIGLVGGDGGIKKVKYGMLGTIGTKGALVAMVEVFGGVFCFINAHLP